MSATWQQDRQQLYRKVREPLPVTDSISTPAVGCSTLHASDAKVTRQMQQTLLDAEVVLLL